VILITYRGLLLYMVSENYVKFLKFLLFITF